MENYQVWLTARKDAEDVQPNMYFERITLLCDTVAIYLAFSEELLNIEELGIKVTDDGCTLIDPNAKLLRCATSWKDMEAFEGFLVQRLIE